AAFVAIPSCPLPAHDRHLSTYQGPRPADSLNVISAPFTDVHVLIAKNVDRASAFSAPVLGVPDNLANIDADECRWRIGHVAELVEGRLRCPGVFLGVEEPEGMLDDVTPVAPRPVAASRAGHAPQHRSTRLTDHGKCLIRPVRLDLDPSDDCTH